MTKLKAILTGSMVYGPQHEDSDIDIVLRREDSNALLESLNDLGVYVTWHPQAHDYLEASCFYFSISSSLPTINIIVAQDEEEFKAWQEATAILKSSVPIQNKEQRYERFHFYFDQAMKGVKQL